MNEPSLKTLLRVYVSLLFLLALTVGATEMHFAPAIATTVSLSIAVMKAVLVLVFFMKLKYEAASLRLFFAGALLWGFLLVALISGDYLTRGLNGVLGK
jgi:cytochrome c oxidase subunit 4